MEKYVEMSLERKQTFANRVVSLIVSVLPVLVCSYIFVLVVSLRYTSFLALAIIICALSLFASYRIFTSFNIDWEYILVDDEIRFSKIINKTRRKEIITVSLQKTEAVARV